MDNKKPTPYPMHLSGDVLKPDFEHAINKENPFYMKKVVVSGMSDSDKIEISKELKELGADINGSVSSKTNFLIIGETPGPTKLNKMQANIEEGKEAKIITFEEYKVMKNRSIKTNK
jgi:DNA polymerase III subunit epsilon